LRKASFNQNRKNLKKYNNNTSGFTGITWHAITKRWQARIGADGKRIHLGYFENKEEAYEKYLEAKKYYHEFSPIPR
jgi:AP2 domain